MLVGVVIFGVSNVAILQVGGMILAVVGVVIEWVVSPISLRNAVDRYNSLQQQAKFNFGINRKGIGLTYTF